MAYNSNEWQATVHGMVGPSEAWTNRWTFLVLTNTTPVDSIKANLRQFYQGIDDELSDQWEASAVVIRNLGDEISYYPSWTNIPGLSSADLLPTQLAIRVTLDDLQGHSGGPFLCGVCVQNNGSTGKVVSGTKTAISNAINTLASSLLSDGLELRIDRPSVGTTVAALQARIGERFDVIRKRADDTPESYTVVDLA